MLLEQQDIHGKQSKKKKRASIYTLYTLQKLIQSEIKCKPKTMEHLGKNLCDLGLGKDFLHTSNI